MIKIKNYVRKVFIIRIDVKAFRAFSTHTTIATSVALSVASDNVNNVCFNTVLFSFNKSFIQFIIAFNRFSGFSNIAVIKEIYLENSYTCQLYYPRHLSVLCWHLWGQVQVLRYTHGRYGLDCYNTSGACKTKKQTKYLYKVLSLMT